MSWVAAAVAGGAIVGGVMSSNASKNAANTQAGAADRASQTQLQMFNQTQGNLQPWMGTGQTSLQSLSQGAGLNTPDWTKYLQDNPDVAADPYFAKNPEAHYNQYGKAEGRQISQANTGVGAGSLVKPFSMQDFQESPAYQFNLQEGQKAIDKASAARGKFYAPSTLQDISKFSQGLASNEFQNSFSNYNTNLNNIWSRLSGLSGSGQNAAANLGGFGANTANQIGNNITGAGNAQAAGTVGQANAVTGAMGQGYNAYLLNQIIGNQQQSSVPGGSPNSAGDYGVFA